MRSLQIHSTLDNDNNNIGTSPGIQPAVKKCSSQCLKVVEFVLKDLIMMLLSFVDILLDALVCRQFYLNDKMEFFYASLSILILTRE